MTSIIYEDIYNDFLGRITDPKLVSLTIDDANELMGEYLHKAVAQPYIDRLFSVRSYEEFTFDFELESPIDDIRDEEFVKNILGMGMVIEWLSPQVRSRVNNAQFFGGSEQKFYSQSAHISELRGLLEDTQTDLRKAIRDRGYIHNSYLGT